MRADLKEEYHATELASSIEPCSLSKQTVPRFRVDGECLEYQKVPLSIARSLVTRFKIMASLDIAERRRPQDGKIRACPTDRELELRVSTIPTARGNEDLVSTLLAPQDLRRVSKSKVEVLPNPGPIPAGAGNPLVSSTL